MNKIQLAAMIKNKIETTGDIIVMEYSLHSNNTIVGRFTDDTHLYRFTLDLINLQVNFFLISNKNKQGEIEMSELKETLKERNTNYGGYKLGVDSRAGILEILIYQYREINNKDMPVSQIIWLTDLIAKLCRISSTPSHTDSIHDLQGYSKLIEEMLKNEL